MDWKDYAKDIKLFEVFNKDINLMSEVDIVDINSLNEIKDNIFIYNGNITKINADAVVNTTNYNMISSLAGKRIEDDCSIIIDKQGHLDYPGSAKITRGYYLPSKFIIHTVAPIIRTSTPTKEQEKQLKSCYNSCLDIAGEIDEINTVVLPCIATGVLGYPKEKAALIAVDIVTKWIDENPDKISKIIFNVSSKEDEEIYINALNE
ncbi:MAG: macro domain-containing protein [Romboutsia sp.]